MNIEVEITGLETALGNTLDNRLLNEARGMSMNAD
jgi:hypothetical protein